MVGHSLGGSTAALLALRLGPKLRSSGAASVTAYCFNPLPVLSPKALAAVGQRGKARFHADIVKPLLERRRIHHAGADIGGG